MSKQTSSTMAAASVAAAMLALIGCALAQTVKRPTDEELKAKRDSAQQYYSIGASYFQQQQFESALENFRRALCYDSTYYEVYTAIGAAYRKMVDPISAEEYFRKAIKLDPKKAKAYEGLGDLFMVMRRDTAALAVYQDGLAHDSSLVDLYNSIAEVYVRWGEIAKADSMRQQAMERFPPARGNAAESVVSIMDYFPAAVGMNWTYERLEPDPDGSKNAKYVKCKAASTSEGERIVQLDETGFLGGLKFTNSFTYAVSAVDARVYLCSVHDQLGTKPYVNRPVVLRIPTLGSRVTWDRNQYDADGNQDAVDEYSASFVSPCTTVAGVYTSVLRVTKKTYVLGSLVKQYEALGVGRKDDTGRHLSVLEERYYAPQVGLVKELHFYTGQFMNGRVMGEFSTQLVKSSRP